MRRNSSVKKQPNSSSVGKVIQSFSQAFGITKSQFNAQAVVLYKDGKVIPDNDQLSDILRCGTRNEKLDSLKLLQEEMANFTCEKRIEIWNTIKSNINLKKEGIIRTESLRFLQEMLGFQETPLLLGLEFYTTITESINLIGVDKDMKIFLICLHNLIKFADLNTFEKYQQNSLDQFLVQNFKKIIQYNSEELSMLIISLISECIKLDPTLFKDDDLHFLLDSIITINLKTSNVLVIQSFLDFFQSYLLTGCNYTDHLYTIVSILGCANGLEEIETNAKCDIFIGKLFTNGDLKNLLLNFCDVITGRFDETYGHREGNRPIIGCIRYLSEVLNYLDDNSDTGTIVKAFFDHHLNFLFETFILVAQKKDASISIEIIKFLVEALEKPYTLNGYYKYLIERNSFWRLIFALNWNIESPILTSYQNILNELFNKLQNFKLDEFYVAKLVEYFASNYQILSSYNISFVLNYYSKNLICACGSPNWKQNCENIVEKYYITSPTEVMTLLKDAFLYCTTLKIDESCLKFYINLICYDCIINLKFKLEDDILEPLTEVIINLDMNLCMKVINDYLLQVQNKDEKNRELLLKTLIISFLKTTNHCYMKQKTSILLTALVQLAENLQHKEDKKLLILPMILLIRLRAFKTNNEKHYYILGFENEISHNDLVVSQYCNSGRNVNENIDSRINTILNDLLDDFKFKIIISKFFHNGRTNSFVSAFDLNILIQCYIKVLSETKIWEHYFIVLKNLKYQLLNDELLGKECTKYITNLVDLFTKQLQLIYSFKFERPLWLQIKHIHIAIVEVLYGFFPYKNIIGLKQSETLLRAIVIDFHFCDITRDCLLNFINCCLYEIPEVMEHFINPMLKMIHDNLSKPETFFSNLQFFFNLLELRIYELQKETSQTLFESLDFILRYESEPNDINYKEIKCSKVLAKFLIRKLEERTGKKQYNNVSSDYVLEHKDKIAIINIITDGYDLKNILKKLVESYQANDFANVTSIKMNTKTAENTDALCKIYDGNIKIILSGKDLTNDLMNSCLDRTIVISQIQGNKKLYSISDYGFEFVNIKSVVLEEANIIACLGVIINLCLVSTESF